MKTLAIAASFSLAALMVPAAVSAQEVTLGEQVVPAEQMTIVEDWCKELQAQQGLTGTQEPESTMTEEQAETAAGDVDEAIEGAIDLNTVTLEQCQDAGLTDQESD
ncbi:hypothetical protein [Devosia aurantiaca]|uniref:Uncharacterized protein n=1 Tax=Devosia aurantiaca TaxID=2714858 RepID=A0A6M1SQJ8_9HYPH|nr:hypothetical protein [Devosia aurantiaca]NGP19430.1 hypothetical protein [Devosia aurantiaca]